MDIQQGFTLLQHIKYFVFSLFVATVSFYLDVHYGDLEYKTNRHVQSSHSIQSDFILTRYEVTHGEVPVINI